YDYELPGTEHDDRRFTATVAVKPKPDVPDWTTLEVPYVEPEVPQEAVAAELEGLRSSVAELVPVEDRPVVEGDTVVVDLVTPGGEAQRDYVVELGQGRLLDELEAGIVGMQAGETKQVEAELGDDSTAAIEVTVKEIKEKVLPPLDDDLARAASEFETLGELRGEIESRLREQREAEAEGEDVEATLESLRASGHLDELRYDLRLRNALDRVAAEVKRIPAELAAAREKLWTPEKEKTSADTKL